MSELKHRTHSTRKRSNRRRWLIALGVVFVFGSLALYMLRQSKPESVPVDAVYKDPTASVELRVKDLLSYMTLEEKVAQMALTEKNSLIAPEHIAELGLGALLSGSGSKPADNTATGWLTMVEAFQAQARTSRLGIPLLYGVDAVHGHAHVPGATVFPHAIGLGATGDVKLTEAVARATAEEIAATGINWSLSPTFVQPRDIRWGRTYEAFSDDPELVRVLGAASVRGLQDGKDSHVIATLKHYVGLGDMQWNTSSNKNFRIDQAMTKADELQLREVYLPTFQESIDAGAASVMVGLNSWGDTKLAASTYLLTDVLKGELGFNGLVVSDWYGVYEIPGGDFLAAVKAINAGVDMVMLPFDYQTFIRNVTTAVRLRLIPESRIDDAVGRILRVKFATGLFDVPTDTPVDMSVIGSSEHRALARKAAARSLVLLQNKNAVLPITNAVRHIRVAGSAADNVGRQSGAWTVEWQGIDGNWLQDSTSILAGIESRARAGVRVDYSEGGEFKDAGVTADLGIAIVGEKPYAEGWGDREYPILDDGDRKAIKNLQAVCDKVVVVIVSGRPLLIEQEVATFDGLVMAWLPGSEGAGVADVLFGDVPFTGTLPLPWPRTSEQLPISKDGVTFDGTPVLFPRYFGL